MKIFAFLHREEWVALVVASGASILNIAVYKNTFSLKETVFNMARYFTFGDPFFALFFVFIYIFYLFWFYRRLTFAVIERVLYKKPFPRASAKNVFLFIITPFRVIAPLVIVGLSMYALLGNFDYQLRFSMNDVALLRTDIFIFGSPPFIWLANTFSSPVFTALFKSAYFSLGIIMSVTLALLFFFARKPPYSLLFRKAVLSFIMSLIVAFPIFYLVPCQDPNNYFIRNLRNNAFSQNMKNMLAGYYPSQETKDIIARIADAETNESADNSVPVSCFPSMHAIWSLLSLYFLYALTPWTLLFTIPWVAFLLAGGLYFAQHYFVDYLVAIPVIIASITFAKTMLRQEKQRV